MLKTPGWRASVATAFAGLALCAISCSEPQPFAEGEWPALHKLSERYSLQIVWESQQYPVAIQHGTISGSVPAKEAVAAYVPILDTQLNRYPAETVRAAKLRRVVLVQNLTLNGRGLHGLADFGPNTLYLDVGRLADNPEQMKKCIHHEFFHVMDYMAGTLSSDPNWEQLNPANFAYAGGNRFAAVRDDAYVWSDARSGFLNDYATTAAEEDKAELFAFLMVRYNLVKERAKKDKVLRAKMDYLKRSVAEFSPEMGADFWE
jgi:hypothetical protein